MIKMSAKLKYEEVKQIHDYIQGESKKRGISKDLAITPLKSIRKGKSWCVSENSALMLQDRHQTVQN